MSEKKNLPAEAKQSFLQSLLPQKRGKALAMDLTKKLFLIVTGSLLYAVAISLLLDPNSLAPGGVSGIAIIISHFLPIPTGTLIIAINIPLMIWGAIKLGLGTMLSTIFTTFFSSWLVNLLATYPPITSDPLLASIFGGAALGLSMVMIFKAESTTGGTDIIVRIIRLKLPHFTTGKLFLMTDTIIVAASALVFKNIETGLYAGLACTVFSFVFDHALYGGDTAKLIYIISSVPDKIAKHLLEELDLGVSYLHGEGAYSGNEKKIVFCAMKKQFFPKVRKLVLEEDPNAFLIVGQASEVFGEGFKAHNEPLL
ncbi:MAG: YitT family protein [Bacillota bacterium]|nr:YitT family protein [Bacillota bacterium]